MFDGFNLIPQVKISNSRPCKILTLKYLAKNIETEEKKSSSCRHKVQVHGFSQEAENKHAFTHAVNQTKAFGL